MSSRAVAGCLRLQADQKYRDEQPRSAKRQIAAKERQQEISRQCADRRSAEAFLSVKRNRRHAERHEQRFRPRKNRRQPPHQRVNRRHAAGQELRKAKNRQHIRNCARKKPADAEKNEQPPTVGAVLLRLSCGRQFRLRNGCNNTRKARPDISDRGQGNCAFQLRLHHHQMVHVKRHPEQHQQKLAVAHQIERRQKKDQRRNPAVGAQENPDKFRHKENQRSNHTGIVYRLLRIPIVLIEQPERQRNHCDQPKPQTKPAAFIDPKQIADIKKLHRLVSHRLSAKNPIHIIIPHRRENVKNIIRARSTVPRAPQKALESRLPLRKAGICGKKTEFRNAAEWTTT